MGIVHLLDAVLDHGTNVDSELKVTNLYLWHNNGIGLPTVGERVEFSPYTTADIEIVIAISDIPAEVRCRYHCLHCGREKDSGSGRISPECRHRPLVAEITGRGASSNKYDGVLIIVNVTLQRCISVE